MLRRIITDLSSFLVLSILFLPGARADTVLEVDLARDQVFSPLAVPGFGNVVLFATNSIQVERSCQILSGDLVVNEATPGPTLNDSGFELELQGGATTAAGYSVRADSVELDNGSVVGGDVVSNELDSDGTIEGTIVSSLSLPVFRELPPFEEAQPRIGAPPVVVPAGGSTTLAAGRYDGVQVGQGAVLTLAGGTYHLGSLVTGKGSSVLFEAPSEVRVGGRIDIGRESLVAPAAGVSLGGSQLVFYVGGFDGLDGQLGSLPIAANVDRDSTLEANIYAPFGTLVLEVGTAARGAFLARDLRVKRGSMVELDSRFGNRAPTADPQTVYTSGSDPIEILLTGTDPEGESLMFSIVTPPTEGTLTTPSHIVPDPVTDPDTGETAQPPTTSATVTYTPDGTDDLEDSFVFAASDPAGASGMATVLINPPPDSPPPPPPDTVVADDISDSTFRDTDLVVTLVADAADGVEVGFSILSGPSTGDLGPLTPGIESPVHTATATYTPNTGFLGTDSFVFEACGTIAGVVECDSATFTIDVVEVPQEQDDLARDQSVTGFGGVPTSIDLSGGDAVPESGVQSFVLEPRAAFLDPVEVAGNVADANGDGLGDNHNDLPGSAPVFISAGVAQSGGAGSNGTVRIHAEWLLSDVQVAPGDLVSADVLLNTHRGTIDSLDTYFYVGALDEQGTLEDSDFESIVEELPGVVMPVPQDLAVGEDGTFSFSVLDRLRTALEVGAGALVVQGRVDESFAGPARGLQVRSSASGNVQDFLQPQLSITTPGVVVPVQYRIETLPAHGTLFDSQGVSIVEAGTLLPGPNVTYQPEQRYLGPDQFTYSAELASTVDTATVFVQVVAGDCVDSDQFCDDGR